MGPAELVLIILAGVALLQLAIWVPLGIVFHKKHAAFFEAFDREVAENRERVVVPKEPGTYAGGTGAYRAVNGTGTIVLTDRRLVFSKKSGDVVEIPTSKIRGVREDRAFRMRRVGGRTFLVVETTDPAEVGFLVGDVAAWMRAIRATSPQ